MSVVVGKYHHASGSSRSVIRGYYHCSGVLIFDATSTSKVLVGMPRMCWNWRINGDAAVRHRWFLVSRSTLVVLVN